MFGWTILFGLISLCGALLCAGSAAAPVCLKSASFLFGLLFLVSLLTYVVRGPAR